MANQPELDQWDSGVYQLEQTDPVLAGLGGVSNKPLVNLANRTKYLYNRIAEILGIAKAYSLAGGTANAITAAYTPTVAALTDGMVLRFKGGLANTGAATFTPNSGTVAASPIYGNDYQPLTGGEIVVNGNCTVVWNAALNSGNGAWVLTENGGGIRKGVTPGQFDNSMKLATTAAIQRALGSFSSTANNGATTIVLGASDIGSMVYLSSPSAKTVTLPNTAGFAGGAAIALQNYSGTGSATINAYGGASVIDNTIGATSSITLLPGESVILSFDGNYWRCFGTYTMRIGAPFAANLSGSGYQKLPSGLILQWGSGSTASSAGSVTFPIAFPTAFANASIVRSSASTSTDMNSFAWSTATKTSMNVLSYQASTTFLYMAIGY
jgi:hypothetical protein